MSTLTDVLDKLTELIDRVASLETAAKAPPRQAWRPREVADMTGIGYEVVLQLIHDGQLRAVKAGRLHVVPDAEVQRYLNELKAA